MQFPVKLTQSMFGLLEYFQNSNYQAMTNKATQRQLSFTMQQSVQKTLKVVDNALAPLALEVAKIDAETQEDSYSSPESKGLTGVYLVFKEDLGNLCSLKP